MRLIDADALKVYHGICVGRNLGGTRAIVLKADIDKAPTIEAEPVKRSNMIYVITMGEYSDYHICACTTDKATAEEIKAYYARVSGPYGMETLDIEEFEDISLTDWRSRVPYFRVRMYRDEHIEVKEVEPDMDLNKAFRDFDGNLVIIVQAKDEGKAFKIAVDKFAEYKYREQEQNNESCR